MRAFVAVADFVVRDGSGSVWMLAADKGLSGNDASECRTHCSMAL